MLKMADFDNDLAELWNMYISIVFYRLIVAHLLFVILGRLY